MPANMDFLQSLEPPLPPFERAISHMIQGTLEYPASIENRAAKIADDTIFLFKTEGDIETDSVFVSLWAILVEMAWRIPAGHEWQKCLVLALGIIRQREGAPNEEAPEYKWHDLPKLDIRIREHWELRPFQGDELPPNVFAFWKNTNSFVSQLVSDGFTKVLYLAFWEISEALEISPIQGPIMDCQVWVAAEWLICCSKLLFKKLTSTEELSESETQSLMPGDLYGNNLAPLSLQRWQFWGKRLTEILHEVDSSVVLQDDTKIHVQEALKVMGSEPE